MAESNPPPNPGRITRCPHGIFRYAAHDWTNDNLPDDVHNEEFCGQFNYEAERFTGMSQDGAMHMAIDDARGET